jgi:hypothetical protein
MPQGVSLFTHLADIPSAGTLPREGLSRHTEYGVGFLPLGVHVHEFPETKNHYQKENDYQVFIAFCRKHVIICVQFFHSDSSVYV